MTRGPAKPISALGSAMFRSPSIAKLAVTPPVVGSVSTEMYGSRARSSRASAALILAICISESAPSIMRAPPEQDTITTGSRRSMARSIGSRDLLADDHAHAAADEGVLHRRDDARLAVDLARGGDDRVLHAGGLPRGPQPFGVRLRVHELQGIDRRQALVVRDEPAAVEQHPQPVGRANPEVVPAFRADVEAGGEVLVVDRLRAAGALHPQAFRNLAGLCRATTPSACGSS